MNSRRRNETSGRYVRLTEQTLLRRLEKPFLYSRATDELYEVNEEAFAALSLCDGSSTVEEIGLPGDFLDYCLTEGLLECLAAPERRPVANAEFTLGPSLRYLELQITWRCNLACRHCYLGVSRPLDLSLQEIEEVCRQFEALGGLRLLVSGGEPLAHPRWEEVNALLSALKVRRVLLTNGHLLNEERLSKLSCDEVQLSLDGMRAGHEALRGQASFDAVLDAARRVRERGLALSIATQCHAANLSEFDRMEELVFELGAREWGIDAPILSGRLHANPELRVTPQEAARAMAHGFGGAYHGGNDGMACGLHLATVGAQGSVAQCGFYFDRPLGKIDDGLAAAWIGRMPLSLSHVPLCAGCDASPECAGGCRYRAGAPDLPDPVMCAAFGRQDT